MLVVEMSLGFWVEVHFQREREKKRVRLEREEERERERAMDSMICARRCFICLVIFFFN